LIVDFSEVSESLADVVGVRKHCTIVRNGRADRTAPCAQHGDKPVGLKTHVCKEKLCNEVRFTWTSARRSPQAHRESATIVGEIFRRTTHEKECTPTLLAGINEVNKEQRRIFLQEQYMMYQKAITAKDPKVAQQKLATEKPGEQKWLAKKLETLDMKTWHKAKSEVVAEGNVCKFRCNQDLKGKLLATGERELVEASPSGRQWGIGFVAEYAEERREEWGQNLLGQALMTVRARLQAEQMGA
ncbi:MAG: hypothetical protein Q9213_008341, partial [Squamulea squamosa]